MHAVLSFPTSKVERITAYERLSSANLQSGGAEAFLLSPPCASACAGAGARARPRARARQYSPLRAPVLICTCLARVFDFFLIVLPPVTYHVSSKSLAAASTVSMRALLGLVLAAAAGRASGAAPAARGPPFITTLSGDGGPPVGETYVGTPGTSTLYMRSLATVDANVRGPFTPARGVGSAVGALAPNSAPSAPLSSLC